MRVGAIDCGTNSIRLLVSDVDADGVAHDVVRLNRIVRLGHGVDRTGRLDPDAIERTLTAATAYADLCREHRVERVRFVATSASRDASNADVFVAGVREVFADWGIAPEVVSGDEEARLSFRGATGSVAAAGHVGPYLVVDLGGGSTEFVLGDRDVESALSVDIGSVRLTERHLRSDPPTTAEIEAARADVHAALAAVREVVDFGRVRTLVGLAGSITTVTAHALELTAYEPERIHLSEVPVEALVAAADDLLARSREARAALPYLHPGRVDVIGAGALVWREVLTEVAAASGVTTAVTSEHDILDGIAASLVGAQS